MGPIDGREARVVVYAPVGRDGPASAALLHRSGLDVEVCASMETVLASVSLGVAAVCVTEEALFGANLQAMSDWVHGQPAWSDLPFVVLTSRVQQPAVAAWRQKMVAALRNVSLLERPVQAITLTSAVHAAVRARMRQYETRALLREQEEAAAILEDTVRARTMELEAANAQLRQQMKERAQVEETLRHAQKMEALGQLTGGVAHDFNNLLMVISGGLQMFDRQADPNRRARLIQAMQQAVERGAGLTRQLLAFSRRQPLQAEPVDLVRQVHGMREMLDRSLRGDIKVGLRLPAGLWPVEVDPGELELVLLNLAVNARDAMPSGGTIEIRAENMPGVDDGVLKGDFVGLSVVDTGTGMTEEVKARVFEPFFTTKDVGKGSGLGLAQAYGFARQSGGDVRIYTQLGRGTTVRLMLPRCLKPPSEPVPEAGAAIDTAASCAHVLVVEDDDEVAALVGEMMAQLGFEATRVASPAAALGALADGRHIDVVFSDIMMPGGMSGLELVREIRARRFALPIVLTTGFMGQEARAAESDGIPLLPKPYRLEDLGNVLRTVLGGCDSASGA
ncbi:hybrid sensor histidine kinase/response regulator [Bordetella genomosp. 8]|uniref:histidine kinase n=1 Tax=Bordetella genomosp. 8 TaxID=1416806 RepID=A0A1W6YL48_9BORD|nr:ATP-binding protein [Bordetella genomosp. 8]ARP81724.1 hybrid sensor histidine kinase/response regulator [Bordetella genomosp. 8]